MRRLIISAVLVVSPACSLFERTERSQLSQEPDAGPDNDACHSGSDLYPDGGCCGGTQDGGPQIWPDGGPQDGGAYSQDGGAYSPEGAPIDLPDGG